MTQLNLYDTTVVPIIFVLQNLSKILKKGEGFADAKGISHTEFCTTRLAPDMNDFAFQVHSASNTAKFLAIRVARVENQPWEDNEKTFDELQARISKTIKFLEAVKRDDFEGAESKEVTLRDRKYTGLDYVNNFGMPNFYFHAMTIYNILRMKGVDVGKKDWLDWQ